MISTVWIIVNQHFVIKHIYKNFNCEFTEKNAYMLTHFMELIMKLPKSTFIVVQNSQYFISFTLQKYT